MRFRPSYPWIAALMWVSSLLPAQEAALRYGLHPGETCGLEIELHQNTHSESAGSDEITLYCRMNIDFSVDSVDPGGMIHMVAGYGDLHLSMLAPSMGIDINSESGREPMLAELLDSLQQKEFRLVMHPSGELGSLEEITPVIRELVTAASSDTRHREVILSTLDEVYGTSAFQSMFQLFVSVYPVVQPIRNWTRDLTYYFNTKPVQMTNRYFLTKTTDRVIIIQGLGMLNSAGDFREEEGAREVRSSVSGSQTFDFQMDIETGWLKQCVSRQRAVVETTIISDPMLPRGLQIPSYTETLFEVKGTHAGHKPEPDE